MAYGAMLLAMIIVSGNFVFGNHAMQDLPALPLSFWRTVIATLCLLPLALISRKNIAAFFFENKLKAITLVLTGVVLPPWFIYLALNSSKASRSECWLHVDSTHDGPVIGRFSQ